MTDTTEEKIKVLKKSVVDLKWQLEQAIDALKLAAIELDAAAEIIADIGNPQDAENCTQRAKEARDIVLKFT